MAGVRSQVAAMRVRPAVKLEPELNVLRAALAPSAAVVDRAYSASGLPKNAWTRCALILVKYGQARWTTSKHAGRCIGMHAGISLNSACEVASERPTRDRGGPDRPDLRAQLMCTQGPAAAPNGGGSAVKATVKLDIAPLMAALLPESPGWYFLSSGIAHSTACVLNAAVASAMNGPELALTPDPLEVAAAASQRHPDRRS
jgi:hypothetical protein